MRTTGNLSYRVGPHGYIHGWIFVGAPGVGANVFHPHHGHGTVTGHDAQHVTVNFSGKTHTFGHSRTSPIEPSVSGPPHLERRPESDGGEPGVMTAAEAKKWGNANWPAPGELPADQRNALRSYSGPAAYQINKYLRTGKIPQHNRDDRKPTAAEREQFRSIIASLDRATKGNPTPTQAMVVHRGTGLAEFGNVTPDKLIGQEVRDPAFLSTSVGKSLSQMFSSEDVHLVLNVPEGTPAFWMDKISTHPGERELLLGRGLSYKITSARKVRGRYGQQWYVEGEVVPAARTARRGQEAVMDEWTGQWTAAFAASSERFNKMHGAPGSGHGGQFVSATGGGGTTKTATHTKTTAAKPPHNVPHHPVTTGKYTSGHRAELKRQITAKIHADETKITTLEHELHQQETALKTAAAHAAHHKAKAASAHHSATAHHHAQHAHHHRKAMSHRARIRQIRTELHALRTEVKGLREQSAKL